MSAILPDPNHPDYQRARVAMAGHMFAIDRSEPKSGYGRMADELMCGDLMEVPTWLSLGMLAQASVVADQERDGLRAALVKADAAIREMFRYYDGGETRGSYDGKPERDQLRKAGYVVSAALAREQGK